MKVRRCCVRSSELFCFAIMSICLLYQSYIYDESEVVAIYLDYPLKQHLLISPGTSLFLLSLAYALNFQK